MLTINIFCLETCALLHMCNIWQTVDVCNSATAGKVDRNDEGKWAKIPMGFSTFWSSAIDYTRTNVVCRYMDITHGTGTGRDKND